MQAPLTSEHDPTVGRRRHGELRGCERPLPLLCGHLRSGHVPDRCRRAGGLRDTSPAFATACDGSLPYGPRSTPSAADVRGRLRLLRPPRVGWEEKGGHAATRAYTRARLKSPRPRPRAIRPHESNGGTRAIRDSPPDVGACHRVVRPETHLFFSGHSTVDASDTYKRASRAWSARWPVSPKGQRPHRK